MVIAGHKAAVERACAAAKARGAKRAVPLAVSAPFHCALMQPAAERLAAELERVEIAAPEVPVVTNVEAAPNQDPARVRELLTRQVTAPVRWEESVQRLASMGVTRAIEVGAGNVLAGLVRRIAPAITTASAGDPEAIVALATECRGGSCKCVSKRVNWKGRSRSSPAAPAASGAPSPSRSGARAPR